MEWSAIHPRLRRVGGRMQVLRLLSVSCVFWRLASVLGVFFVCVIGCHPRIVCCSLLCAVSSLYRAASCHCAMLVTDGPFSVCGDFYGWGSGPITVFGKTSEYMVVVPLISMVVVCVDVFRAVVFHHVNGEFVESIFHQSRQRLWFHSCCN